MIYIEFIERDRFMPIEIFRHLGRQSSDWADSAADKLVLQIGRTLRLGPMPSYLVFWEINDIGRLDEWEAYFKFNPGPHKPSQSGDAPGHAHSARWALRHAVRIEEHQLSALLSGVLS